MSDSYLNTVQAASILGLKPSTLEAWRMYGRGPPWIRMGPRIVRYRLSDLNQWISENIVENKRAGH